MHRNLADDDPITSIAAYEVFALSRLRRRGATPAAQRRTRDDLDLSPHVVAAGRLQLPTSADLLGLRRRGDRAFWIMGRRLDDIGATVALPALGHFRDRQCAADNASRRAMVSAVAVRALARRQRPLRLCPAAPLHTKCALLPRGTEISRPSWFDVFQGGHQRCAGKSATGVTILARSIYWPHWPLSWSSSRLGIISAKVLQHHGSQALLCQAKAFDGEAMKLAQAGLSRPPDYGERPGSTVSCGRGRLARAGICEDGSAGVASTLPEPSAGSLTDSSRFDSYDRHR